MRSSGRQPWIRMTLYLVALIVSSLGLAYLIQYLMSYFHVSVERFAATAYFVLFGVVLVSNAGIVVPVVAHIPLIMLVASQFDPVLTALVASVAGTLGEITGYYAGYLGKRIVFAENTPGYDRLALWMKKYGMMAVFLVSLQPVLPVDVAGLIAGTSRMPLWKFLLPCWAGKFPKYILLCYFGFGLINLLPL